MTGFFDYGAAGNTDPAGGGQQQQPTDAAETVLAGLSEDDWQHIRDHAEIRWYRPDEVVIDEGDVGRDLFIVLSGEVSALVRVGRLGARRRRQPMRAGAVFGEIAFFAGGRRTAAIVATTDAELLRLRFEDFQNLAAQDPHLAQRIVFDLGRVLAARLVRAERSEAAEVAR